MTRYRVNWDNGNHACGTFPQVFDSEDAAQKFADNWVFETVCEIDDPDMETPSAEVIELDEDEEWLDWYAFGGDTPSPREGGGNA